MGRVLESPRPLRSGNRRHRESSTRMKWVLLAAAIVAVVYFVRTRRNGR